MFALPDISKVAASSSPASVTLLNPVIFFELSTIAALLAATVPAVIPSIDSKSFSFNEAVPRTKVAAVIVPLAVRLRNDPISLFASTCTNLLAATVPAVTPSIAAVAAGVA